MSSAPRTRFSKPTKDLPTPHCGHGTGFSIPSPRLPLYVDWLTKANKLGGSKIVHGGAVSGNKSEISLFGGGARSWCELPRRKSGIPPFYPMARVRAPDELVRLTSVERFDRHRDSRAAESPAYCCYLNSACVPASRDRHCSAGTERHRISQVYPSVPGSVPLSSRWEQSFPPGSFVSPHN
jgi:hypothetical protein